MPVSCRKAGRAWHAAIKAYEQDVFALIPQEPDWDIEFRRDPVAAHANQKVYQTLYKKLSDSRAMRAEREVKDCRRGAGSLKAVCGNGDMPASYR